jgi:hypothetical protein
MPEKKIDKQKILSQIRQIPKEKYQIGDQTIWFHGLKSRQMQQWLNDTKDSEQISPDLANARLIQMSAHDAEGNLLFDETDIMALGEMSVLDERPMMDVINRINGIGRESNEAILKNLLKILGTDGVYGLLASINAPCPSCSKGTPSTSSGSST